MLDKELNAVKSGDKKAFDELAKRFLPLIKKETVASVSRSEELREHYDEIYQEALVALYNAAISYDGEKNVTFGLYAKICIHNGIISYARKIKSQFKRLNKMKLSAEKGEKKSDETEELIEALDKNSELRRIINEELSAYEKKVFSLYLQKKSYADIASSLGKDEKSVDNALSRAKSKIKKAFN